MLETPIVLIVFNRPVLTRRALGAILTVSPRKLFLVGDGPRLGCPEDIERVAAVREELCRIDSGVEVLTRHSEINLGCEANVETGLDWVFSQVDRAIVLEDDCLPDATFFQYAEELLDRYADDPRVWHIAGNRHWVPGRTFGDRSYAFSTWASVWGWATWANRWHEHRARFPRDHVHRSDKDRGDTPVRTEPAAPLPGTLVTRAAERHFRRAAVSNDVITHGWDKHWWLTIMAAGGLSATPAVNLVENCGFGADATHGTAERRGEPTTPIAFPLVHPDVVLDVEVERELELVLNRIGGPVANSARRLIRSPRLRAVLRRAADSRLGVATARTASRLSARSHGGLTRHG